MHKNIGLSLKFAKNLTRVKEELVKLFLKTKREKRATDEHKTAQQIGLKIYYIEDTH